VLYEPYDTYYPRKQVTLLRLYNYLGLPHVKKKLVFGHALNIIGLYVDLSSMTITMPSDACDKLVSAIHAFIDMASSRCHPLVKWQRMLGWINWSLNAFPLCCPALQSAYAKIAGKQVARAKIYLNHAVIHNFTWLMSMIEASDGVHMMHAVK